MSTVLVICPGVGPAGACRSVVSALVRRGFTPRVLAEVAAGGTDREWIAAAVEAANRSPGAALLGLGPGAEIALLAACAGRGIGPTALVGGALRRRELDAAHPLQPLEMLLNLESPLLRIALGEPADVAEHEFEHAVLERSLRPFRWHAMIGPGYADEALTLLDAAASRYDVAAAERVLDWTTDFLTSAAE